MSGVRALILDAGGVLVYPLHGDWNIPARYQELLGDYARDLPSERWRAASTAEAAILREDVIVPDLTTELALRKAYLAAVAVRMGWTLSEKQLQALAEDFNYNHDRYCWYDDARPWLNRWKTSTRLGMLSDAMPSFHAFTVHHKLGEIFESIVISTEIGACKPDPRIYAAICARMDVSPNDCLFVDDRACNLAGAIDFGMRAVQMCRDGATDWDGPKVRNFAELNDYMEGLH